MKILLLEHPRRVNLQRCNDIANTPLASCLLSGYIAGMLKSKGYNVEIVEGYLEKLSYEEIEEVIRSIKPDVLGVHKVYHWEKDVILYNFLKKIKNQGLASYITVYGYYPTFAFNEILKDCSEIDSVILGEPEVTFSELAENLIENKPLKNFHGIAQRGSGGGIISKRAKLIEDLDKVPFPIRTEASFSIGEVNLLGSRGCYGTCTFCYINPFNGIGVPWRGRSPKNIIEEIDIIILERNIKDFYFTDPNFFGPGKKGQERALQIAELLKSRRINFGIEARVNDIHDETIKALVEAGLRHILIGLESGRDEALKRMNKMTTVKQNERALKILRKYGIEPNVGFIMFEPDSSLQDIRTNFDFLKRNHLLERLEISVNVLYHHQIILQGTSAYRSLQGQGRLERTSDSTYEASTTYTNEQVALLADLMREITNHIFYHLDDLWSGRVEEPKDIKVRYNKANILLVDLFEETLTKLEEERFFTREEIKDIIEEVKGQINELLYLTIEKRVLSY